MNGFLRRLRPFSAVVLLVLAGAQAGGCWGPLPPERSIEIPELALEKTLRPAVLRTYGQPRQKTGLELWYVGPTRQGLLHGASGWMTLLTFDAKNRLIAQDQLRRRAEPGYAVVEYRLRGDLTGRDRDRDFDALMKAACAELAESHPEYLLATDSDELFVLAHRLPGGNEEVARWTARTVRQERSDVAMTVRALVGRDEPLLDAIDGAIGRRMLLIEVVHDAERHPVTDFTPGSGR